MTRIRAIEARDRQRLEAIVSSAGNFSAEEVATALELIDEAIATKNEGDYIIFVAESADLIRGYVCIGPTPLTDGVYDLYWIVVEAASRGSSHGRNLLRFAEEEVKRRGGRMILIETSSLESYKKTRAFYVRAGYAEVARIPNFYKVGDDKITYAKSL